MYMYPVDVLRLAAERFCTCLAIIMVLGRALRLHYAKRKGVPPQPRNVNSCCFSCGIYIALS